MVYAACIAIGEHQNNVAVDAGDGPEQISLGFALFFFLHNEIPFLEGISPSGLSEIC